MSIASIARSARESAGIIRRGWPLLAIAFCVDAAFLFVFLIVLQTYLPESLGKSEAIAGYALAAFGIAKLLTQLASGFVTDRLGARRAIVAGTVLLLVADASILPLAHASAWVIVGSGAIAGLGSSVTWPAVYAAADARFGAHEKARFGSLLALSSGGALLVALGGGTALNSAISFNLAMIAPITGVSIAFVLAAVIAVRSRSEGHMQAELPHPGQFRAVLGHPQRAAFAMLVLAEAAGIGALTAGYRAYGRDVLDVSLAEQNLLLVPAAICGGLAVIPGGMLADRFGVRRTLVPGFALTGVCMILLSQWSSPGFVLITGGITGAGFGLAMPSIAATMMSLAGSTSNRGGVIGWFMTMDGIGHAAGPASAGLLLALFGASAVLIAAGAMFIGVAYIALTSRIGERELAPAAAPALAPEMPLPEVVEVQP
jgi:MFS family permease